MEKKTRPYPYKNEEYVMSCMFCGNSFSNMNLHITRAVYKEHWVEVAAEKQGATPEDFEVVHVEGLRSIDK